MGEVGYKTTSDASHLRINMASIMDLAGAAIGTLAHGDVCEAAKMSNG